MLKEKDNLTILLSLLVIMVLALSATCYADDIEELKLTGEQLRRYTDSYKLPEVLHLRKFLNTYADSRDRVDPNEDWAARDLDSRKIDKKILKDRFIVYWIQGAVGGGKVITIVSQKHPEIILDFWIYKVTEKIYQVRRLLDKQDERDLKIFKIQFRRYLNDENLSM